MKRDLLELLFGLIYVISIILILGVIKQLSLLHIALINADIIISPSIARYRNYLTIALVLVILSPFLYSHIENISNSKAK